MTAFPKPALPIFLIVLVDVMGFTIVYPLLPFYAEHFGASGSKYILGRRHHPAKLS